MRRLHLTGSPPVLLADDKAVTAHLAPMQPKWGYRKGRSLRIHLLNWFRNQGERSRLVLRGGHVIGRIYAT